jgi:hypothetical protein
VKYVNIAYVTVSGEEGNDLVTVLSTNPSVLLSLYGGLGSDSFVLTPRTVGPVVSKNLRGHRGIIEHEITSNDTYYNGLAVRGVAANVMDNDGNYGYVFVVDQGGFHLMYENETLGDFTFWVYPTVKPEGNVTVNVVPPAAPNEKSYLVINGNEEAGILTFESGNMTPQAVHGKFILFAQLSSLIAFKKFRSIRPQSSTITQLRN